MGFHNINEEIVTNKVNDIFDFIEKNGNPEKVCACQLCRIDVICYTLNRIKPLYVVSSRGFARIEQDSLEKQQKEVDIVALIYDGIRLIQQRRRPNSDHSHGSAFWVLSDEPSFRIPVISGRILNGLNFAPMEDIEVMLLHHGEQVEMLDDNWRNPYNLVNNTVGVFTFLPKPIKADVEGIQMRLSFAVKSTKDGFDELYHSFEVALTSEKHNNHMSSAENIIRLPDLYMFPVGNESEELEL